MTFEVLHRRTRFGWEFRCPLLLAVQGGSRDLAGSRCSAEHAVRLARSRTRSTPVALEIAQRQVHHVVVD